MNNGHKNGDEQPAESGQKRVGPGHPPIEYQFKKGNPGGPGRPKGSTLTERLRNILDRQINGKSVAEALVEAGVKAALSGDYRFWEAIFNRIDGKVPDRFAGHDGGAIKVATLQFNLDAIRDDPEAQAAVKLLADREAAHMLERMNDDEAEQVD